MSLTELIGRAVIDAATTSTPSAPSLPAYNPIGHDGRVIVRTYSAGVFYARLASRADGEALLIDSRRVWRWKGASELTDLAVNGPRDPSECKISPEVDERLVLDVIEIIPCSPEAVRVIDGVPAWTSLTERSGDGYGDGSGYGYGDGSG